MAKLLLVLTFAICAGACASAPVVPIRGELSAAASLAGEWHGTYSSRARGRTGSIWFKLIEGESHAHGDVMMTGAGAPYAFRRDAPDRYPQMYGQSGGRDRFLTIRFVRAADGRIDGVLDPYWDPDCECQVITAFRGDVLDGRIVGTFVSHFGESIATGRWEATRRRGGSN